MKSTPKISNEINTAIPLPSLPQILFKLIDVCKNNADNHEEIVRIISLDPGITLKLMRLTSVWHNQKPGDQTFEKTVRLLGLENIRNIALAALVEPLAKPVMKNAAFAFNRFWFHSLQCAFLSRKLAETLGFGFSGDAYLSGLLHDIGKLILWMNYPKEYEPIFIQSTRGSDIIKEEGDRIGTTHCEAGWIAVQNNSVRPFVADGILYHHQPVAEIASAFPLLKIIYAANIICHRKAEVIPLSKLLESIGLHLPSQNLEGIIEETDRTIHAAINFLGLNPDVFKKGNEQKSAGSFRPIYGFLEEIRGSTLAQTVAGGNYAGSDQKTVQKELLISLQNVFDTVSAFFFYYNPTDNILVGSSTQDNPRDTFADSLELPFNPDSNLLSAALQQGEVLDSFGQLTLAPVNIADNQLIGLLDAGGMICLPLLADQRRIGVIAAGIESVQIPTLSELLPLLKQFCEHAGALLHPYAYSDDRTVARPSGSDSEDKVDQESLKRIIHEVNNPLGIIRNYLRVLSSKVEDTVETDEEIGLIREEIARIPAIIRQLAGAQVRTGRNGEQVNINTVVNDLSRLLKNAVLEPSNISLHFNPDQQLPPFKGAKNDLNQVMINILKNAVEAMPQGGNIFIKTAFQPSEKNGTAGTIVISIRDDGPGIPEKIMNRLFIPGNTTKGPDNFGLGLSISKDVIKRYNGLISCESRAHEGTTFTIKLPVSHINSNS